MCCGTPERKPLPTPLADHSRARATRREAIAATLTDNREGAEGDEEAEDAAEVRILERPQYFLPLDSTRQNFLPSPAARAVSAETNGNFRKRPGLAGFEVNNMRFRAQQM